MQPRKFWMFATSFLIALIIATVGRLIPHLPNATPLASLALLSGYLFEKRMGLLLIFLSLLISDVLLSFIDGYAAFGAWSVFTYSGFMVITLLSPTVCSQHRFLKLAGYIVGITLFYWVWTNLGTWLVTNIYPRSVYGLWSCFTMGLPFLRNALVGNLIYSSLFLLGINPAVSYFKQQMVEKHV